MKDIRLVKGNGSPDRGGDKGGFYWHIYTGEQRAGYVFINIIDDDIIGEHPSIQIHINKNKRDKGIGRVAYKLACENSNYEEIFAHMRKSNKASRKAAEYAGFKKVSNDDISQLVMVWKKNF
jgi:RimJ/RimL family protein N-acetyltransferase